MPSYADLNPAVQKIVDMKAEALAEREGLAVEEARELLAARVSVTQTSTQGTGH